MYDTYVDGGGGSAAVSKVADALPAKLVHVLVHEPLAATTAFVAQHADALKASGVDVDVVVSKARLLALTAACGDLLAGELSYAAAAAALQVPVADVERYMVDGACVRMQRVCHVAVGVLTHNRWGRGRRALQAD
jgi:hypothetical protein